jgi:cell division protein FtsI/penicillin-binding protein 2
MNPNTPRFRLFIIGFYIVLCALFLRAFYLQVLKRDFYQQKSQLQLVKSISIYPHRGNIYDRNEKPLALTKVAYSVFAFPHTMKEKERFVNEASAILDIQPEVLSKKVYTKFPFVWIKRKVSPEAYTALKRLKIEGLDFIQEERRIYPHQRLASHVLGFVGIDNQGLSGLEYLFDPFLKGSAGKIMLEGDPRGFRVASGYKKIVDKPYDGGDIMTTLDERIQYSTQKFLREGVEENGALGGVAIVMDPRSGDILAFASYPDFNSNMWNESDQNARRNRGISDVYEPGSVFKIVTIASVLEEKLAKPNEVIYVPETLEVGGRTIKEAHPREPGETDRRTVSEVLEKSLNVGTTLLAKRLGEKKLFEYIEKFGFGKKTGVELPGESQGLLRKLNQWSGADIGMISFGQGIAVTAMQMVSAVTPIANGGIWIKPRLIQHITYHQNMSIKGFGKVDRGRVISEKTAKDITEMLIKAVESGTGASAKMQGYWVAGKTGTAQKPSANGVGYMPGQYIASFLGFFPAKNPQFLILVIVDTPVKSIYGGSVAAPIFRKIAADIVDYRHLPPERVTSSNVIKSY